MSDSPVSGLAGDPGSQPQGRTPLDPVTLAVLKGRLEQIAAPGLDLQGEIIDAEIEAVEDLAG